AADGDAGTAGIRRRRLRRQHLHPPIGIDQGIVPMVANYEGSTEEPVVLPAAFPNLLVNGAYGIAVGLSSYLPPHDPREVCAAAKQLIENPKATVEELMEVLPGPSFPSPCTITNGDELIDIYRSGQGRVTVRGAWTVEDLGRGRQQLVITSLPYADTMLGSTEKFVGLLADAVDAGDVGGVTSLNDESSDGQVRITIGLATGVAGEQLIPALLKYTNLQVTNKVQMHFLDEHGIVRLYNLRTVLRAWIDHRVRVIIKRSENRMERIAERLHRLAGYLAVLIDIDETIAIVRTSKTRAIARERLCARWEIDESQANAVLDLNLGQLTEDAVIEFRREAEELRKEAERLRILLASPTKLRRQVGIELDEVVPAFDGVALRVTDIVTEAQPRVSRAAMVLDTPASVAVDANGWAQATRAGAKTKLKLEPLFTFETSTAASLVVLTNAGQLHRTLVAAVPTDKPTAAASLFAGLDPAAKVLGWWIDETFPDDLLYVMSDGQVKRTSGDDLVGGDRKGGIATVKCAPGEEVVAVLPFVEGTPLLIATAGGQGIRFLPDDVRPMGRSASGVRGMKLSPGDRVVGAGWAADEHVLLAAAAKGAGRRVPVEEFAVQGRAGKGVRAAASGGKQGLLVAACTVPANQAGVLVRTSDGSVVEVNVGAFPQVSRDGASGKIRNFDGVVAAFLVD
ncbi:MAG: DNA topoisomerase (ATP-hydrolyzing) subunit A, partial [Ilumatobacteraceae bacterium]